MAGTELPRVNVLSKSSGWSSHCIIYAVLPKIIANELLIASSAKKCWTFLGMEKYWGDGTFSRTNKRYCWCSLPPGNFKESKSRIISSGSRHHVVYGMYIKRALFPWTTTLLMQVQAKKKGTRKLYNIGRNETKLSWGVVNEHWIQKWPVSEFRWDEETMMRVCYFFEHHFRGSYLLCLRSWATGSVDVLNNWEHMV